MCRPKRRCSKKELWRFCFTHSAARQKQNDSSTQLKVTSVRERNYAPCVVHCALIVEFILTKVGCCAPHTESVYFTLRHTQDMPFNLIT